MKKKMHPIHARIKVLRKEAKLTQTVLAERSGLKWTDVANYETRLIPPLWKLERIAKALKTTVPNLLDGQQATKTAGNNHR